VFKDITINTNIETVFSQLLSNNIFSLPDQDSLRTEKYEYNPETNEFIGSGMGVADGICYSIEFKVGDYYRRYNYCNPDDYANFYPQVYELRNFANIFEIFNEWPKE
jgi:5-hydroxyisourate hydrolase-like protein (transthyretin family)